MVKCSECGFLTIRNFTDGSLIEASDIYRQCGDVPFRNWQQLSYIPLCFVRAYNLREELEKVDLHGTQMADGGRPEAGWTEQLLTVIAGERECEPFTEWQQGFSPKEHREMLDRDNMLRWQRDREESDRAFQAREAVVNRKWRFREFLVAVIGVAVVVGVSLTAAFIERGGHPIINITTSDQPSVTQDIPSGEQSAPSNNTP